jgi:hypothetical protein
MQQCRSAAPAALQHPKRLPNGFDNAKLGPIVSRQLKISNAVAANYDRVLRSDDGAVATYQVLASSGSLCFEVGEIIIARSILNERVGVLADLSIANQKGFVSAPRLAAATAWRASSGRDVSCLVGTALDDAHSVWFSTIAIAGRELPHGDALRPSVRFMPVTSIRSKARTMKNELDRGRWLGWPC